MAVYLDSSNFLFFLVHQKSIWKKIKHCQTSFQAAKKKSESKWMKLKSKFDIPREWAFLWVKSLSSPADMCVCVAHFITEFCQGRGGGNTAPADSHIRSMADLGPRGHPMQSGERERARHQTHNFAVCLAGCSTKKKWEWIKNTLTRTLQRAQTRKVPWNEWW